MARKIDFQGTTMKACYFPKVYDLPVTEEYFYLFLLMQSLTNIALTYFYFKSMSLFMLMDSRMLKALCFWGSGKR